MVSSVDLINSNLRKENDGVKVAINNLASKLNANFLNNLCTNPVYFQEKKKICNVNFSNENQIIFFLSHSTLISLPFQEEKKAEEQR